MVVMIQEKNFNSRLSKLIGDSSLRSFGSLCGVSESVLRKYLRGTSEPGLGNLEKIASACNVTVAWLIGEENERPKNGTVHAHLPNKSMQEMAAWINEQDDGIDYWEAAKARFAHDYPEFREWLKKRAAQRGASTFPIDKSVNGDE